MTPRTRKNRRKERKKERKKRKRKRKKKRRKEKEVGGGVERGVWLFLLCNMVFTSSWQTELFSQYLFGDLNFAASMSLCLVRLLSAALRAGKAWTVAGNVNNRRKNMFSFVLNTGLTCLRVKQRPQRRMALPTLLVWVGSHGRRKGNKKKYSFLSFPCFWIKM